MAEDVESLLAIDELQLDKEWLEQPRLFYRYARLLAEARRVLDEAEAQVGVVRAKMDSLIRNEPEDYGLTKVTEKAVEQALEGHPRLRKAREAVTEAKFNVNVLQAAVTALDHRKRSLENLVTLHGQHYFATPVTKEGREVGESITKRGVRRPIEVRERKQED